MKLLLLSGNNVSNEAWIDLMADTFRGSFDVHVHRYKHWQTGERYIDLDHELNEIETLVQDWNEPYCVFAKSVGTILTMKAVFDHRLHPQKCVFVGVPIQWSIERGFDPKKWLSNFQVPTLFIQQEHDPFLSFADLQELLKAHNHADAPVMKVSGDTHEYENTALVASLACAFLP